MFVPACFHIEDKILSQAFVKKKLYGDWKYFLFWIYSGCMQDRFRQQAVCLSHNQWDNFHSYRIYKNRFQHPGNGIVKDKDPGWKDKKPGMYLL
jgi:hypothetical protein